MTIKSDFAILDVKAGRVALSRHFKKRPALGLCPPKMRVPVVIRGYIDGVHSQDDGVSREFSVTVTEIKQLKSR